MVNILGDAVWAPDAPSTGDGNGMPPGNGMEGDGMPPGNGMEGDGMAAGNGIVVV